jgi:hypothetical protein
LESGRYDFIDGTVENPIINMSVVQIKLVDAYINIETELKPALIEKSKMFFSPSSSSNASVICTNLEAAQCIQNRL